MIMNFINVMIARSTFIAEGEKRMTCLCTNVLLQDRGRRKNLHEAICSFARHILQKLCPDSFISVGIWKNKDALMCSLC